VVAAEARSAAFTQFPPIVIAFAKSMRAHVWAIGRMGYGWELSEAPRVRYAIPAACKNGDGIALPRRLAK
jgi:hypothetical protein